MHIIYMYTYTSQMSWRIVFSKCPQAFKFVHSFRKLLKKGFIRSSRANKRNVNIFRTSSVLHIAHKITSGMKNAPI